MKITLIVAGLIIAAALASARADDIAIQNFRLHIECEGVGSPAVILDAGLGGSSLEWVYVSERLRSLTRVCRFDRGGYGGSDMGPLPRTSSRIVNELYLLLDGAGIAGPYILVGHSFGGYNMQLFARRYPFLTAGLVLIDASHPDQVERFLAPPLNMLTAPSSRYGIVQFRDPPPPNVSLPPTVRHQIAASARRWKTRRTLGSELLSFRDSALQLRNAQALGATPLLVITRGKQDVEPDEKRLLMEKLWLDMQSELAAESPLSAHLLARNAGHHIHIEQPELVAFGIAMLVDRHRLVSGPQTLEASVPQPSVGNFNVSDATWLRDTLDLYPAPGGPAEHLTR